MLIKLLPTTWGFQKGSASVLQSIYAKEESTWVLPEDEGKPKHQEPVFLIFFFSFFILESILKITNFYTFK
jgi:hypothetical protein